jgi:endo-1,3(4)-beta-glucanase
MKKITLLFLTFLTISLGYSQGCVGNSSDSVQGSFAYNYSFATSGTNVIISFQILGTFSGLNGQLKQPGGVFTNMTNNGNQTFEITLGGQVDGTVLTLAFYGGYAGGGVLETIEYVYTVGEVCAPTCTDGVQNGTETGIDCGGPCAACDVNSPTSFTATVGTVGAFSVELLLSATDETSANITYNVTGGATAQTTAGSGVQKSLIIGRLMASTSYSFNVIASDASGNSTGAIIVPVDTLEDTSTACAGQSYEAGTSSNAWSTGYNYTIETLSSGTQVKFTIEILDTGITGVNAELQQENPTTYVAMTNVSGKYESTVSGLTTAQVISYAGRFAYTGGVLITKFFQYTVGDACVLGTKNFEIAGLNVYPNPSLNTWMVKTQNINISSIQVFDVLGKNVLTLKPNASEVTIDGSSLKSGLYFARINTLNGSSSLKLIKN